MDDGDKLEKLTDVLDVEEGALSANTLLDDIDWDSMGMLSVIALAKSNGKTITGRQVREFKTVGEILQAAF